ncbi:uncharacterized protein LOC128176631 [Crassostrea angulata]|uniref:uncharacterized protein LOC128176631 n=1 Tax=Magallana angulata TaxID=2784310 RepID=UPI0022B186CB|nr:uncharacterized protein LOC128176631 [Crassostrea angulata]
MLGKRLKYFVCFIGVALSLFYETESIVTETIFAKCGDKKTLQCLTEDGQKGIIMKGVVVKSNDGKLVLESVTKKDEGLYDCFFIGSSIPVRRYEVKLSESKNNSCK